MTIERFNEIYKTIKKDAVENFNGAYSQYWKNAQGNVALIEDDGYSQQISIKGDLQT